MITFTSLPQWQNTVVSLEPSTTCGESEVAFKNITCSFRYADFFCNAHSLGKLQMVNIQAKLVLQSYYRWQKTPNLKGTVFQKCLRKPGFHLRLSDIWWDDQWSPGTRPEDVYHSNEKDQRCFFLVTDIRKLISLMMSTTTSTS